MKINNKIRTDDTSICLLIFRAATSKKCGSERGALYIGRNKRDESKRTMDDYCIKSLKD